MRAWRTAACALAAMLAASSADAQRAAAARMPGYAPGVDVVDYAFALELPDSGTFIRGDATISLRRNARVKRITLDLAAPLLVTRVDVNGSEVQASHHANVLDVPIGDARDSLQIRVWYEGNVSDGLVIRKDEQGRWTWFGDNWPNRARQWLPTVDHPSGKATVSWAVTAPSSLTVVANGSLVSTTPLTPSALSRTETRWRETRPIATYVMVIAAAPLVRYDVPAPCHVGDERQCVKQSVYVLPENRSWLPGVFTAVDSIVGLFETLVGPFPYEKLAHLQSSTRFGGMENSSAIFYDGRLFSSQRVRDGLLAHETAHQWFGDAVTEREWAHLWLSEGFATYFAALYTRYAHGDSAFHREMAGIRRQILSDKVVASRPVIDTAETDYMRLLNANSYQKGGYVLYMLNERMGDSAFFGALKSYYKTYRHGNAVSDDLRRELERTYTHSLVSFFDQWLERPGVPELSMKWSYDGAQRRAIVMVDQSSPNGAYSLQVPALITDASGNSSRVMIDVPASAHAKLTLPGKFEASPSSIAFDPDARVLARITTP